jgi:hypothetical protein
VIGWLGHGAHMGHNERVQVKNLLEIYLLEDLNMCEDNIKIGLKEMDWEVGE